MNPIINTSIIIVTYNQEEYIEECLNSINNDSFEIIVVDNYSSDATMDIIEKKYPEVKLIKNKENYGYGSAVNIGVQNSKGKYVVILNPDTKLMKDSIQKLTTPLDKKNNLITIPKVVIYGENKINTCSNVEHFTGLTFTRGLGEDINKFNKTEILGGLSGVCFAMERELFLEIGGFDENIFLYMEDAELSWNINSKGLDILYVPNSVIYHHYEFNLPVEKIYYVEKGRYIILRKYFTWKQYIMFLPSLLLTEILTLGYAGLKGREGIKYKLKGVKEGFSKHVEKVNCDRRNLINSLDYKIPENEDLMHNSLKKIANLIYAVNYFVIMGLWNFRISSKITSESEVKNIEK